MRDGYNRNKLRQCHLIDVAKNGASIMRSSQCEFIHFLPKNILNTNYF